jgi:hypothetical protein
LSHQLGLGVDYEQTQLPEVDSKPASGDRI